MSASEMVREFHEAFALPVRTEPTRPGIREEVLRYELLKEEFHEYRDAYLDGDFVGLADALADLIYIIHGTALVYGIPLDEVLAEVHRSNMSKVGPDGEVIYREDGKVMKPATYSPPGIAAILAEHMSDPEVKTA